MFAEFWNTLSLSKRLYGDYLRPVYEQFGMTRMELDILLFLANNPEYDTAKEIVEIRCLTKSHVSMSIHSLVKRGYLSETYHPGNRKTIHLALLPACEECVLNGRQAQAEFFSRMFQGFDREKRKEMEQDFCRISENLRTNFWGGKTEC